VSNSILPPIPIKLQCINCKNEEGDFWSVAPNEIFTNYSYEREYVVGDELVTTTTCPLCRMVNTVYWYRKNSN
jgi:hypothetical protein